MQTIRSIKDEIATLEKQRAEATSMIQELNDEADTMSRKTLTDFRDAESAFQHQRRQSIVQLQLAAAHQTVDDANLSIRVATETLKALKRRKAVFENVITSQRDELKKKQETLSDARKLVEMYERAILNLRDAIARSEADLAALRGDPTPESTPDVEVA